MPNPNRTPYIWDIELPDVNATEHLAMDLAVAIGPGDQVALSGDLGSGKTTLVRAVLRYLAGDGELEVSSPSFTLFQIYELPHFPVVHADLYRVASAEELSEIGWDEAVENAAVLVEWPDRAGAFLKPDRLEIAMAIAARISSTHRMVRLTGHGRWAGRLAQLKAGRALLDATGFGSALRTHMQGDASTRSYERLYQGDGSTAVLMKMPPPAAEKPTSGIRSYNTTAHIAESVRPFVALGRGLRERGFSTPEVYAANMDEGLLLIEDFGSDPFVHGDPPEPVEERYEAAVDLLATLHSMELPETLPVAPRIEYPIPDYDIDALLVECELLFDWYMPYRGASLRDAASRETFLMMWRLALADILQDPRTWVLRDYHSPNLIWLAEREGIQRVGLLDFQDTVLGSPAYDVASLLMDARVDVSDEMELKLLSRYALLRKEYDPSFDPSVFASRYTVLGAQRATKILGIFARLDRRDRKPHYVRHMPRVWNYLMRTLEHPPLAEVKAWYLANVPPPAAPEAHEAEPAAEPVPGAPPQS